MRQIYICTDTVTGLCSALHDAWLENRDADAGIEIRGKTQRQLFCQYKTVVETEHKSQKLQRMLKRYLGYNAYWEILHALLSAEATKGTEVFHVMQTARNIPDSHKIMDHLGAREVAKVFAFSRNVSNEAHMYEEFIRFRELRNGLLFSEIAPKSQILTCIAEHFSDRFPLENWVIYDKTHKVFLVHKMRKKWMLVWGEELKMDFSADVSSDEEIYSGLWKEFFSSVSIRERENPVCQKNHLPVRFRKNMTEFEDAQ